MYRLNTRKRELRFSDIFKADKDELPLAQNNRQSWKYELVVRQICGDDV